MMNDNTNTSVCHLNRLGVSKLVDGCESEAAVYFFRALVECSGSSFMTENLTWLLEPSSTSCPSAESILRTSSSCELKNQSTGAAAPSDPNSNDVDEGMDVYQDALHLIATDESRTHAAILHYNISQVFLRRGQYATAQQWLDRALVMAADNMGASESTASIQFLMWHSMGYCLYRQCDATGALSVYQKAAQLAVSCSLNSEQVAATQNCLGVVLIRSLCNNDTVDREAIVKSALELFESALAVYEQVYGLESSYVATLLNNIARVYCYQSKYRNALPVYERVWAIRRAHYQDDTTSSTLDLAASLCNLAQIYHLCGELDLALMHYFELVELVDSPIAIGHEDDNGSRQHHRDMAVINMYMGDIHIQQGDLDEAKNCLFRALDISQADNNRSVVYRDLAVLLYKLGTLQFQLKAYEDALSSFNHGLHIDQTVLVWNDPQISTTLVNVAQIQNILRQYDDAMITNCRLYSIQVAVHGASSLEVAATLSVMGLLRYQTKNFTSSFDLYLQALQIQRAQFGEEEDENCDIAGTMASLGVVLFHQGSFELSKRCFSDSLRMRRKIFGPDDCENAVLCHDLAAICLKGGDEETAIAYYKETIRIERLYTAGSDRGGHARLLVLHLEQLSALYQRRGDRDQAVECYMEALELEQAKPGGADDANKLQSIGRLHNSIGNLYLQTGRVDLMMKHYERTMQVYRILGDSDETVELVGLNYYMLSKICPPCAAMA